jgi:hypothetical protein
MLSLQSSSTLSSTTPSRGIEVERQVLATLLGIREVQLELAALLHDLELGLVLAVTKIL